MRLKITEHQLQASFFDFIDNLIPIHPQLANIFAIPNGAYLGGKGFLTAKKLKREGLRPGVLDVFVAIPKPKKNYYGMFIEFKVGNNKPSEYQIDWMTRLREKGYPC